MTDNNLGGMFPQDNTPNTVLSVLALLPDTKERIESFAYLLSNELDSGTIDPMKVSSYFKFMEKVEEKIKKKLDEYVLDSISKYGKSTEALGIKWEVSEFGTKYDYSDCGDKTLDSLNKNQLELKSKIEARQKLLKSLTGKTTIVDDTTGEIMELYPPKKTSITGVKKTIL